MQVFKSRRGSAIIEAALIVPLIFLIVFGIISIALSYYGRIVEESMKELQTSYPEDIVRLRRMGITSETGNE